MITPARVKLGFVLRQCALLVGFGLTCSLAIAQTPPSDPKPVGDSSSDAKAQSQKATVTTPDEAVIVMSPFEVSAKSNVGYGAESTSSAGRIAQAYIDVPQTVNVVTSEFMKDFALNETRTAIKYIPNVVVEDSFEQGRAIIRGTQVNQLYIDGMAQSSSAYGSLVLPSEFYDRIEVVKGPSSAAFGLGQPGGIVNFVSKTASGKNQTDLSAGLGDNNNYRVTLDAQGAAGKLWYRLNLIQEHGEELRPDYHHGSSGGQLSLRYPLSPSTTLQWIASAVKITSPGLQTEYDGPFHKFSAEADGYYPFWGNPNPTKVISHFVDWSTPVSNPGFNTNVTKFYRSNLIIDQRLGEHANLRNALMFDDYDEQSHMNLNGLTVVSPTDLEGTNLPLNWPQGGHSVRDTLDFVANYDIFGGHYQTLAGGEWYKLSNHSSFMLDLNPLPSINIYNPVRTDLAPLIAGHTFLDLSDGTEDKTGTGFYVQEQATYFDDRLILLAGWRIDYLDYKSASGAPGAPPTVTAPGRISTKGAPRFAVTYKPEKWLSIYGLYTIHKDPTQSTSTYLVQGEPPPPSWLISQGFPPDVYSPKTFYQPQGTTIEGGVKATLLNGAVTASLAIFHEDNSGSLTVENLHTYTNPDGSTTNVAQTAVLSTKVHGFEFEVTGKVAERLVFTGSIAETRGQGEFTTDHYPNYIDPPTTITFHGKWDLGDLNRNTGFYITGGGEWWGSQYWAQDADLTAFGPGASQHVYIRGGAGQYVLDVGVGYRWAKARQQVYLSCTNLTDQNNYISSGPPGGYAYSSPRQIWCTYSVSF